MPIQQNILEQQIIPNQEIIAIIDKKENQSENCTMAGKFKIELSRFFDRNLPQNLQ